MLTARTIVRFASRLAWIPVAALGLVGVACGGGDNAWNDSEPYYSQQTGNPVDESQLTTEEKQKVALLREAIDTGLSYGKVSLSDELNVELGLAGITKRYEPTTTTNKSYTPPKQTSCPFLSPNPTGENLDCRALLTRATVSSYTRKTSIIKAHPLDSRFMEIKKEGDFWYDEGLSTGIDNEATAALYDLKEAKLCDTSPKPEQSAFDSGVEQGRKLYTVEVNKQLAKAGYSMQYPSNITQITQCNLDTSLLEPARVNAGTAATAYAKDNPLCADYSPSTKEDIALVDEAEKQFSAGMKQGIETEHSLAGEIIFRVVPCNVGDPLVLDLDGNGVTLTPLAESQAAFDLFGSGARLRTAWIQGDDALLAIDRNGNGTIDNGRELFGNFVGDRGFNEVENGFAHLAMYDSDADGAITSADAIFSKLVLWQDRNGNGVSEPGELHSLSEMGVTSIAVNAVLSRSGAISHRANFSRASWAANLAGSATGQIVDVWFNHGRSRVW